ncbi:MAG TPA: COX15/CtaA family protein [Chitinophagaceae bacterium]|nr:COX15/CtaA family protein [Chitinophagaceae bacterium]
MSNTVSSRPVAIWLLIGVFMIMVQVLLGGVTRLTGSGLSITEWKPILGALPPMNEQDWNVAFEKYKQIGQYKFLNPHFSLHDFKSIYFWEWLHRNWARFMGFVFAVPFIIFIIQRRFKKEMINPLLILFILGALQGFIGWIMVASGLNDENIYVNHIRLAIHFMSALGLLCYTFWFALKLLVPPQKVTANTSLRKLTWWIISVLIVQLVYGAFMAGHKAATISSTWPDINGYIIPPNLFKEAPWVSNFTENKTMVQFLHRGLAYLLIILLIFWTLKASLHKSSDFLYKTRWIPVALVLVQVSLGIFTIINSTKIVPQQWGVFEWLAELHQVVAMFLLMSLVWVLYLVKGSKSAVLK